MALLLLLASWSAVQLSPVGRAIGSAGCSFPRNLTGLQCLNLQGDPAKSKTAALCEAGCCANAHCSVWNFSPDGPACSLWTGHPSPGPKCARPEGTWKHWVGGASSQRPPAPSPPRPPSPSPPAHPSTITLDFKAGGPVLAGIGAISGGGATSRLLVDYPEPQRSQLLDMMFTPFKGAALQVLKVEIGGTGFTSDGSEASHCYTEHDDSPVRFSRGYEFWLMKEAKARNPNIVFYGLPWAWPAWVGSRGGMWKNLSLPVEYIVDWVRGAKEHHGLDIAWIGDWYEQFFSSHAA